MRGRDGNDTLNGGDDDDFLERRPRRRHLDGGTGWDRAAYSTGATAGVTVDLNIVGRRPGYRLAGHGYADRHRACLRHPLQRRADRQWRRQLDLGRLGRLGRDRRRHIVGGGGNDLVQVGTGNHTADGGLGTDTLSLHGNGTDITAAGVTVSLALQGGAQATEQGSMILTGFENLSGSTFDDNLTGDGGDNVLAGDTGNDKLVGGAGDDMLYGDGRIGADTHGTGGSGPIVTIAGRRDCSIRCWSTATTCSKAATATTRSTAAAAPTRPAMRARPARSRSISSSASPNGAAGFDTLISIENATGSAFDDALGAAPATMS